MSSQRKITDQEIASVQGWQLWGDVQIEELYRRILSMGIAFKELYEGKPNSIKWDKYDGYCVEERNIFEFLLKNIRLDLAFGEPKKTILKKSLEHLLRLNLAHYLLDYLALHHGNWPDLENYQDQAVIALIKKNMVLDPKEVIERVYGKSKRSKGSRKAVSKLNVTQLFQDWLSLMRGENLNSGLSDIVRRKVWSEAEREIPEICIILDNALHDSKPTVPLLLLDQTLKKERFRYSERILSMALRHTFPPKFSLMQFSAFLKARQSDISQKRRESARKRGKSKISQETASNQA